MTDFFGGVAQVEVLPALKESNSTLPAVSTRLSQNILSDTDVDYHQSEIYKHADDELLALLKEARVPQSPSAQGMLRAWAGLFVLGLLFFWASTRTSNMEKQ